MPLTLPLPLSEISPLPAVTVKLPSLLCLWVGLADRFGLYVDKLLRRNEVAVD